MSLDTKFIFVTGGVVSSLGKGISMASIGAILKSMGYSVMPKKLDPYLNIDPGTMNPIQHGEVFVTEDGSESDLDLGHYERFIDINTSAASNVTAGKIYLELLNKERRGDYLGRTVQVIPHVTDLIKNFIRKGEGEYDFIICEIGGTVGDIEALPFLEAIRQIKYDIGENKTMYAHLTLLPFINASNELKTKPTQHSVKELMSIGIIPDVLFCRSSHPIDADQKRKIANFCNVSQNAVIEALDVDNIHKVPLIYIQQGLHNVIIQKFHLPNKPCKLEYLDEILNKTLIAHSSNKKVTVCIAGKYTTYKDSYKSIVESVNYAAIHLGVNLSIKWVETKDLDGNYQKVKSVLENIDCIIIPGGFGKDGLDGKINIIRYAREYNIPLLGICLGMQMAAIEFARNVLNIKNASTAELEEENTFNVISLMEEQKQKHNLGGTMRLGAYKAGLTKGSLAHKLYDTTQISERHRHRYELDISLKDQYEKAGMMFSGLSPDGLLPEIIEIPSHKFFIAVQFHPEFKSRINFPHPLFVGLLNAAIK